MYINVPVIYYLSNLITILLYYLGYIIILSYILSYLLSTARLILCWFYSLLEIIFKMIDQREKLLANYNLYVLSNTFNEKTLLPVLK